MNQNHEGLVAVLSEQIQCAEAMLRTLGRESQALVDGNGDALNAAGAEKAELVEALEMLESQRRSLTEAIAASMRGAGIATPEAKTVPEWRRLLELIAACKQQNDRNGALVKARSEQVRVALRALRGAEPDFYGRSGHALSPSDPRPLGTA